MRRDSASSSLPRHIGCGDASIRCMIRRTTLAADHADLAVLEAEARRRGVSLAQVLREAVAAEAGRIREQRRPRFGIVRGGGGAATASVADEDAPARGTLRS